MIKINVKPAIHEIYLKDIFRNPDNPRYIEDEALKGLQISLEQFGYVDLLVVNKRNSQLIAGHQRFKILQLAGVEKLPVIMVDVDIDEAQLMGITLNSNQIIAQWTAALIPLLDELRKKFEESFISLRLESLQNQFTYLEIENLDKNIEEIKSQIDDTVECPSCKNRFSYAKS